MKKNILIVNYNTQELTDITIKSINKQTKGCKIYVFDNSDKQPFSNSFDNVEVLDNTKGQIIDFDKLINSYSSELLYDDKAAGFASMKHCYTVDYFIYWLKEPFVLCDSDIVIRRDISCFFDENYVFIGRQRKITKDWKVRLEPFLCFINGKMCVDNDIHYFNEKYMHGLQFSSDSVQYDTGSYFLMAASKLPHKEINIGIYMFHFASGSWKEQGIKLKRWIESKKIYYLENNEIKKEKPKIDESIISLYR